MTWFGSSKTEYIKLDSRQHWLELKAMDVTSTESPALFGLSPYQTELELFYRKQAGEVVTIEDNARMRAGRFLEPSIAEFAAAELGCQVVPFKPYARDPAARMGSSFDFEIINGDLAGWILEIKNVDYLVYRDDWTDDEAPAHIEVQVQHQLELTKSPGAVIAALVGGNDLRLVKRERNPRMGAAIRKRLARFWRDVTENSPPQPDYVRDADFLCSLYQEAGDEVFDASEGEHVATLLRECKRIKKEAADLDTLAKAKKAEIFSLIGLANRVIAPGLKLSCGMTKGTPPRVITEDMVGQELSGRESYRQFRITETKERN